uniref:Uncharacterized protein n=1 Tax=Peronospora matthiolae TaxID=2874970 RepID=A0AAV1URP9_9STRA
MKPRLRGGNHLLACELSGIQQARRPETPRIDPPSKMLNGRSRSGVHLCMPGTSQDGPRTVKAVPESRASEEKVDVVTAKTQE